MPGRQIFISYRRQDSAGHAGRIYDYMVSRFGNEVVFRDVDGIAPGENFVEVLRSSVRSAGVVLVIIGRDWLTMPGANGRRLDDANDFVRLEIEMALEAGIPTIPVLVEGATMPASEQLPASIQKLAHANALQLSEDTFSYECEQLRKRIAKLLGGRQPKRWPWAVAAAGAGVAAVLAWTFVPTAAKTTAPAPEVQAAKELVAMRDYAGAWKTVQPVANPTVREDVAMEWMRNASAPEGHTFSEVVDQLSPVLATGVKQASGPRKGDLLAHLGWGTYLRSRDGLGRLDPEPFYRRALEADPANPFANAMLGHWLLWKDHDAPLDEVRPLFARALASNRERAYVRMIQVSALANESAMAASQELLRAAADILKTKDPVPERLANDVSREYYSAMNPMPIRDAIIGALSPEDHVTLLTWAAAERPSDVTTVWLAQMQEAAGHPDAALAIYERLAAGMERDAQGGVPDAVRAGLKRLKPANR